MQARLKPALLRGAGLALCAAAILAPGAGGHAGHGATEVSIASFAFEPDDVSVVTDDVVLWLWDGPDTNHSVTADPGQDETFDSDPGSAGSVRHRVGDGFQHRFTRPGTYTYFCKVHSFMRGTVRVAEAPPPAESDRTAPRLSSLRARPSRACRRRSRSCRRPGAKITFRLSETADVRVTIKRRGARRSSKRLLAGARKGRNSVRLPIRRLRRGSYLVTVTPTDDAGNRGRSRRARLQIVR